MIPSNRKSSLATLFKRTLINELLPKNHPSISKYWITPRKLTTQGDKVPCNSFYEQALAAITFLLDSIPIELIIQACIRTKAYARALRYLECHMRIMTIKNRLNNHSNVSDAASSLTSTTLQLSMNVGSNRTLPTLTLNQLNQLMSLYAKLEDCDAVKGSIVLKYINGFNVQAEDRIIEAEQVGDWMAALMQYCHHSSPTTSSGSTTTESESNVVYERGRLRCLMEIDQLDAVIDQVHLRLVRIDICLNFDIDLG